jgi:hypothetical protein
MDAGASCSPSHSRETNAITIPDGNKTDERMTTVPKWGVMRRAARCFGVTALFWLLSIIRWPYIIRVENFGGRIRYKWSAGAVSPTMLTSIKSGQIASRSSLALYVIYCGGPRGGLPRIAGLELASH